MSELVAALVTAQSKMDGAKKDAKNPHFKSTYATLESVVDAIKPALIENGLAFIQKFHESTDGVAVETIILHKSGEQLSNGVLAIPASKRDAQGYGSAITYARRYSLQSAFGIAPEDDDGNAASTRSAVESPQTQKPPQHKQPYAPPSKSTPEGRVGVDLAYWKKASEEECDTPDELAAWWKDNELAINKLQPMEKTVLIAHCAELKAKMQAKPQTVECPLGGAKTAVDCAECDNREKCAVKLG